jgi:hypothetical protein
MSLGEWSPEARAVYNLSILLMVAQTGRETV